MFNKILPIILFEITILSCFGCDDEKITNNGTDIPDSNVSYLQHIQPIFNIHCVNCHGVGITEGGVDLTTHSGATDPRIVFAGEPDNSLLVWTIEQRPGFPPMPPLESSYLPLDTNQVKGVKTWIREGAKNN